MKKNDREFSICFVLFLFFVSVNAQISISGYVKDEQGIAIISANLRLQKEGQNQILAYALTDKEGRFTINYTEKQDSLQIIISAFNYAKKVLIVKNNNEVLELVLKSEITELKEVKIQKEAIVRNNDTLIFNVSSFASKNDRSIGDIIAKLPGIEMEKGVIKYGGKPISVYYTQGKNLLGTQYIMANESIAFDNIDNISIMKNHQPVKVLEGEQETDTAALNIQFKKSALYKPNSTISVSTVFGSENLSWNGEAFTILVGEKRQAMADYQGNNIGNTIKDIRQIGSILDRGLLSAESTIGVNPSNKDYYFLFNNANAIKSKILVPVSKKQDIKIETFCLNDHLSKTSEAKTTYFFPDNSTVEVIEPHRNIENKNQMRLDATLVKNLNKDYFINTFTLFGSWRNIRDDIFSEPVVYQNQGNNNYKLENKLQLIHLKGKSRYNLESFVSYEEHPEYLSVEPSSLFKNQGVDYENLYQQVNAKTVLFRNSAGLTQKTKIGNIGLNPQFSIDFKRLNSQLFDEKGDSQIPLKVDFSNHFENLKLRFAIDAIYEFSSRDKRFTINFTVPVVFDCITAKDAVLAQSEKACRFYTNMYARAKYILSNCYWLNANYSLANNFSGVNETGYGFIMVNYRTLTSNGIANFANLKNTSNNYRFELEHGNIESFLSAKIGVFYSVTSSNQIFAQSINTQGTINTIVNKKSQQISKGFMTTINKYFVGSKTTIGSDFRYNKSSFERILENNLIKVENELITLEIFAKSNLYKWLEANYNFGYNISGSNNFSGEQQKSTSSFFSHKFSVLSSIEKWSFKYALESNYVQFNKKRYNFSEATVFYKASKRFDFSLIGRNLSNIKNMSSAIYKDNTLVVSSYELRKISILIGISFYL